MSSINNTLEVTYIKAQKEKPLEMGYDFFQYMRMQYPHVAYVIKADLEFMLRGNKVPGIILNPTFYTKLCTSKTTLEVSTLTLIPLTQIPDQAFCINAE